MITLTRPRRDLLLAPKPARSLFLARPDYLKPSDPDQLVLIDWADGAPEGCVRARQWEPSGIRGVWSASELLRKHELLGRPPKGDLRCLRALQELRRLDEAADACRVAGARGVLSGIDRTAPTKVTR